MYVYQIDNDSDVRPTMKNKSFKLLNFVQVMLDHKRGEPDQSVLIPAKPAACGRRSRSVARKGPAKPAFKQVWG